MQREGRIPEASKYFSSGDYFEHYVNFNQPEMVPVMQAAVDAGNGFANFWLGNFYYHNFRYDEAKIAWDAADRMHPGNPMILINLAGYEEYQMNDLKKSIALLSEALKLNPMDVFTRQRLISAERANNTSSDDLLKIYLDAPKNQRDGYLYNRGLLKAFENAGKWKEAADYLQTVDRRWSNDVGSWYDFCTGYADYLLERSKPEEALAWIAKSNQTPSNLSDMNFPADYFYRQREFFITAQVYKIEGETSKSQEYFRKVIDEQTDFLFNESDELKLAHLRFYVALSMKELGMEAAARGMMVGINASRLKFGLVPLKLDKSEMDYWNKKDQFSGSARVE